MAIFLVTFLLSRVISNVQYLVFVLSFIFWVWMFVSQEEYKMLVEKATQVFEDVEKAQV